MKTFLVELHLPAGDATALAAAGERARSAAEELTREGSPVRWVRSVYVPEDGSCFVVMEGASLAAIGEAGRRAELDCQQITEGGDRT
jgi:hypothetical protein